MTAPTPESVAREAGLRHSLPRAQLLMIGLGGAIGTGLFAGSGMAIGYAGPAVLISYAVAALIAAAMVLSLSEMAVMHPAAGSFGTYAEIYLNPFAGFVARSTYWFAQVIAIAGEATAAGLYMQWWLPEVPLWMWSAGFAATLVWVNTLAVNRFGTLEYWLTLIKVSAIVAFIVLGGSRVLGIGAEAPGFDNLTGQEGGFMPFGLHGVWMAVIVATFSFVGIEVIAVTAGEAEDPRSAVPAALRGMAIRLFLFYVLALGIMLTLTPWREVGQTEVSRSPFVTVFAGFGIPYAAGLMNFVVLSAALSSMNTNLYLTSRMLFSLSRAGFLPAFLGRLGSGATPALAAWTTGVFVLLASMLSWFTPRAYNYLFGIALFGAMVIWILVFLSHFRFRARHVKTDLPLRTALFPVPQIIGLVLLVALLLTMGLDEGFWRVSWLVGVPWLLLLALFYRFSQTTFRRSSR